MVVTLELLRFADDMVLISDNLPEIEELLFQLKTASNNIGLNATRQLKTTKRVFSLNRLSVSMAQLELWKNVYLIQKAINLP